MDVLKVLGQSNPSATTYTTLYTAPNLYQTTISSLVVCNKGTASQTFRISVHVAAADTGAPTNKQFIFYDAPIAASATMTAVLGLTLAQSDVIQVYASSGDLAFNLFGVETT
jgi:hypothetical protein